MKKKYAQNLLSTCITISTCILCLSQASCKSKLLNSRLTIASAGKISSIDPAQASSFHSLQLISALGDTLYKINKHGKLIPNLAIAMPIISKDGKRISIKLRDDVLFHDGTKFNAKAMAFSINRFKKIGRLNYILDGRIESVNAADEYLLNIKLTRKSSSLPALLTSVNLTPISPKSYSKHKDTFLNKEFIGTGPYKLIKFNSLQQRIVPFGKYWGENPKNTGIDLITLSNSTSLFGALKSGEIDVLLSNSMNADHLKALNKMAKDGLINEGIGPALEIGYITLRSNSPPFDSQLVRESLLYSIDRELISNRVTYGLRKPLWSLVPPNLWNKEKAPWPAYNPVKTQTLLKKLGYCNGKKLNLPFTFRSNVPSDKLLALTWQAQLKRDLQDCIKMELQGVESTTVYRQLGLGAFELVMLDWRGTYPDPNNYLTPFLSCKKINQTNCVIGESASSGSFWASYLIQSLLEDSDKETGSKRTELLKTIEDYAAKGASYLPVWLVNPLAWSQLNIIKPEFDSSGYLLISKLEKLNQWED